MAVVEVKESFDKDAWNALVSSVPQGTIFQSAYWADYLKGSGYAKPFFFICREADRYKGILLFWIERLTARTRPGNRLLGCCEGVSRRLGLAFGTWMYGPLIFDRDRYPETLECFVSAVDRFAREKRLVFVRSLGSPILYHLGSPERDERGCYDRFAFTHKMKSSLFIDLSKGADALWEGLGKYTRKDVRSCARHNLTVGFLKENELTHYDRLMAENRKRVKAGHPPHYPGEDMWRALRDRDARHMEVLGVKSEGGLVGAVGMFEYNGIIFQMGSCQSDESYHKKINVNDLMTWEIIKWGAANKKRFYDLTGIPVNPANKKEEGLRNFKMKWSDRRVDFDSYYKIYRKALHGVLDAVKRLVG